MYEKIQYSYRHEKSNGKKCGKKLGSRFSLQKAL
jgi:hypothetical protein